jgi:hypothetical protein
MSRVTLGALLVMASALTGGCAKKKDLIIRNPLLVGQVDQPNEIVRQNGWRARLLRLDTEAVCFDLELAQSQAHSTPDVDLTGQDVLMKAGGTWYRDARVVEQDVPRVSSYEGTVPQRYRTGTVRECTHRDHNQRCDRWRERDTYAYRRVPATYYEAQGGGVVCFPNHGRVTTTSDRVVFTVNRVHFRWGLQDIVQEPAEAERAEASGRPDG